jgi:serine protease AprX
MMKKAFAYTHTHTANWRRAISALVITALLVPLLVVAPAADAPLRIQPILLQMAAERPDESVRVIVHKLGLPSPGSGRTVEELVLRMGGRILRDLHIINAFATELPAETVPVLARASGVRWISLDAPVVTSGKGGGKPSGEPLPPTYFLDTLRVRQVWDMGLQGQGITVAVIDSGINNEQDFRQRRVLTDVNFNPDSLAQTDGFGHGTHVAGIIGGNGYASDGLYAGIAPQVNLINLKINNNDGMAYESDTVDALQWAFDHRSEYNVRVVNLSINSTVEGEYHTSPLDAAAEILWFNGIVVVASSGNKGLGGERNTANAAPANDPFVITVGASDEHSTADRNDDAVAPFTAHGFTQLGYYKPEIIAPGKDIISVLSNNCELHVDYPDRVVEVGQLSKYVRLSGTSMSAPMVAGAAALLLQDEPDLTPDQVKHRLISTASSIGSYPYLDVYAAVTGTTTESANQGIMPHMLLAKMALMAYWASDSGGDSIDWGSVNWDSVNWDSVDWDAVDWDSVNWDSVNWDSVNWDSVNWDSVNWDSVNWDSVNWDSVNWDSVNWDSIHWDD